MTTLKKIGIGIPLLLTAAIVTACAPSAEAPAPASTPASPTWHETTVTRPGPAEDLVALSGASLVVSSTPGGEGAASGSDGVSGEGAAEPVSGRISLLSAETGDEVAFYPDAAVPAASVAEPFQECASEPDRTRFSPHGIDAVKTDDGYRVYAVNHGGRESVEVFDVEGDSLTWVGCVLLPAGTSGNGIAALGNGGDFAVTNFYDPTKGLSVFQDMFAGVDTGDVRVWRAESGWSTIPGSEAPGPNGIVVSPDGATAYAAIWPEKKVVSIDLESGEQSTVAEFEFLPDNLRWSEDGRIVVTGQDIVFEDILVCNAGKGTDCPEGFTVVYVDPETGETETAYETERSDILLATVAAPVGDEIWVGNLGRGAIVRLIPGE